MTDLPCRIAFGYPQIHDFPPAAGFCWVFWSSKWLNSLGKSRFETSNYPVFWAAGGGQKILLNFDHSDETKRVFWRGLFTWHCIRTEQIMVKNDRTKLRTEWISSQQKSGRWMDGARMPWGYRRHKVFLTHTKENTFERPAGAKILQCNQFTVSKTVRI